MDIHILKKAKVAQMQLMVSLCFFVLALLLSLFCWQSIIATKFVPLFYNSSFIAQLLAYFFLQSSTKDMVKTVMKKNTKNADEMPSQQ